MSPAPRPQPHHRARYSLSLGILPDAACTNAQTAQGTMSNANVERDENVSAERDVDTGASVHHRRAIERRAMSLRVLVIGAGRMGRVHLDAMRGSDHVEPVAVVEPFPASRDHLA